MISCRVVRRHVDAHVDGELDTTTQVEFDSHLASCPHCRDDAALTRAIKAETKRALGGARAPDELRKRLLLALEKAPPPSALPVEAAPRSVSSPPSSAAFVAEAVVPSTAPADRRRGYLVAVRYVVPAAAAAVVFAAFASRSGGGEGASEGAEASAAPLFEDVVRRHASEYPTEVRGSEREVSGWFRGKLDFQARPVVFGSDADAELVGGRLSSVREQDAAAFYYDVRGHRVTVMVFEPPRDMASGAERARIGDRDVFYRQVRGYTVPVVERDGLTYAFTGDLDAQSMIRLAASAAPAN